MSNPGKNIPLWLWHSRHLVQQGMFAGGFCYRVKKWHVHVASAFSLARLAEPILLLNTLWREEMGIEAFDCEAGAVS